MGPMKTYKDFKLNFGGGLSEGKIGRLTEAVKKPHTFIGILQGGSQSDTDGKDSRGQNVVIDMIDVDYWDEELRTVKNPEKNIAFANLGTHFGTSLQNGILKNARKGLVLYDFTTSYPAETKKLARRAEKKGIAYLDAGMGRGTTRKLVLMIGGDQKAFRRSKRFLTPIVEKTFHLGELGSGHAMKLVHNMVLHTIFVSTCEGARIIERMGMKVEDMIDIFNTSVVYSYVSRHRFPNNILSGKWNTNSRVFNLHKDVGMAVKLGKKHGAEVSLAENTFSFLGKAIKRGMREKDFSLLYRDFEQIRKVR